jgi:peptidoglycan biosynthesis protein MviN/MurJ (putative lipid II flippase)
VFVPPGRLERNSCIHVGAWVASAPAVAGLFFFLLFLVHILVIIVAIDFAPWLQSPYEGEADEKLLESLTAALRQVVDTEGNFIYLHCLC